MSPESQNLVTLLEQLALKVVMLEEDDVQGLSGFLTHLEELQAQVPQVQELAPFFQHMTEVGQRLVLREVETAARALEGVSAIFRLFHTLKGVAGFLNLAQMRELSNEVEWLLDQVRDGQVMVSAELVNIVLEAVDFLKVMLVDLQGTLAEGRGLVVFDLIPVKTKIGQVDATSSILTPRLGEILVEQQELPQEELSEILERQKTMEPSPLRVKVAGGSQVLGDREFFKIGRRNYAALRKIFLKNNVLIDNEDVGGTKARTLFLEIATGNIWIKVMGQNAREL